MRRLALASLLLVVAVPAASAQSLYMPRPIKRTYAEGTRAKDGKPGPNYWQNHASYTISISAMPPDRLITGSEQITYVNNSPDTLKTLTIRLFGNMHKPGAPRSGGATGESMTSGVHIRSFSVNGTRQHWNDSPRYFTWQPVRLPEALAPKDSVKLSFDWYYDLVQRPGREGVIDSTTFYLAYFYPRVAVYDDYNGWDQMDHTSKEFYSDFNNYDVTVKVPANFVVWGTGTLKNADSLLQAEPLARFKASFTSDSVIKVASGTDIGGGKVTEQGATNSWHFTSTHVPDVAFGVSDHYDWDAGSVEVARGRRASAQAAYNDTASDFHQMVKYVKHSLDFLSHEWPGVPYPYEKMTAFQGGAGMEYPMMANDQSYPDPAFAQFVVAHEIAHTYMPFYMGINETRYAFMDEGWATTFEYLINQKDMGDSAATKLYQQFRINGWARSMDLAQDLPIITPADAITGSAYGINAYGKPSLGYLAIKDMLGDDLFRKCLHAYMERWNGKHPTPWDFFYTFDDVAGRPLDWFWTNWYFSNGYIDLAVKNVKKSRGGYDVTVNNVGGMYAPFDLIVTLADGTTQRLHQTAAVWQKNGDQVVIPVRASGAVKSVEIDGGIWVDANTGDNGWKGK
jgi:hypothetical protein